MPWDESVDMFPGAAEMQEYLVRYVKKFDLYKYIQFNCKVTWVDFENKTVEQK